MTARGGIYGDHYGDGTEVDASPSPPAPEGVEPVAVEDDPALGDAVLVRATVVEAPGEEGFLRVAIEQTNSTNRRREAVVETHLSQLVFPAPASHWKVSWTEDGANYQHVFDSEAGAMHFAARALEPHNGGSIEPLYAASPAPQEVGEIVAELKRRAEEAWQERPHARVNEHDYLLDLAKEIESGSYRKESSDA